MTGFLSLLVAICLATGLLMAPTPSYANSKYSSIVINAYNGKVLFSRGADARRYPASLTKVMTLYLLFEALDTGKVTLQTQMKASKRAAGQAPSKLGLKPGKTISVEQAIRVLVVKSANDVATVVAEHLGGSEFKFAQAMTKKAKSIGMKNTQFRNASGLPNRAQYTTARDMAILSRSVMNRFPTYYKYFAVKSFAWGGKKYRTHNALLKDFKGTDGIKTGYIRASGFNLTTSVKRDGFHLIGVVFGGRSPKTRDAHMRQILTKQFTRVASDPTLGRRYAVIPRPTPKPGSSMAVAVAAISPKTESAKMEPMQNVADARGSMRPVLEEGDAGYTEDYEETTTASLMPQIGSSDPIGDLIAAKDIDAGALPSSKHPIVLKAMPGSMSAGASLLDVVNRPPEGHAKLNARLADKLAFYGVQIGAYGFEKLAQQRLTVAVEKAPDILSGALFTILPITVDGRTLYRARIGPFQETEAQSICDALQMRNLSCMTVLDPNWRKIAALQ